MKGKKISVCSCENSTADNAFETAMGFIELMQMRKMCEKQMLAAALVVITVTTQLVEVVVDAHARVDYDANPGDMVDMLTAFASSQEFATGQKAEVKKTMDDYVGSNPDARTRVNALYDAARASVPGFTEMKERVNEHMASVDPISQLLAAILNSASKPH